MKSNQSFGRRRIVVLALAGLSLVLSPVGRAHADDGKVGTDKDGIDKKVLTFTARTADFGVGLPKCQGAICIVPFNDFAIADGDLSGSSIGSGSFVQTSSTKGYAIRLGYFTGTLTGCPGGGTAMGVTVTRIDATRGNSGTVKFLEGSGTGGLTGIRGSFTFTADPAPGSPIVAKGSADCRG